MYFWNTTLSRDMFAGKVAPVLEVLNETWLKFSSALTLSALAPSALTLSALNTSY